ncbi:ABC transporter permease [Diplocloster agilis]|uniref:ABC transporter permease n=1 Tax=Diplocloster agilis TaxID=2850323 RepID=UPI0008218176|nr:ABC transporter permease [Suonthocola fibrivorans]MCU6735694.1 ABC transporter permease [Suonthocola fibrivorans]SCJ79935.1 Ribose transport system permease protein rbsC [uncultured Clostridium sp.]
MKKLLSKNEFYLSAILLLVCLMIGSINGVFFSSGNIVDLIRTAIPYGIFGVSILLVILSGGIDVSFPAIATLSTYITLLGFVNGNYKGNLFLFFLIPCVIGLLLGAVNGVLIAFFEFPPLIVTLATQSIYYGIQYTFFGSKRLTFLPEYINEFSKAGLFTVIDENGMSYVFPVYFLVLVAVLLITFFVLKFTIAGRGIYAVGGSAGSAVRVGFNVKLLQILVYGTAGAVAAIGGVVYTIMTRQGNPASLTGLEMTIISIAVLGGIDINGGKGSVFGLILGLTFFTVINNSLILIGLSSYWKTFVLGVAMYLYAATIAYKNKLQKNRVHEIANEGLERKKG